MRRINARSEDGISVVELTIAMALLLLVATSMVSVFHSIQRASLRQSARSETTDEVRLVMQRMTKEIRQATTIRSASTASFLDMDTYVGGVETRVRYTASGTTLTRQEGAAAAVTVMDRLTTTSLFAYAPDAATASTVTITLTARPEHFEGDDVEVTLTSEVKRRNGG